MGSMSAAWLDRSSIMAVSLKPGPPDASGTTTWETSLPSFNGVWRRLELSAPGGAAMEIAGIQVARKDALGGIGTPGVPVRPKPRPRPLDKKPAPIPQDN